LIAANPAYPLSGGADACGDELGDPLVLIGQETT
jgi:hypothetical protein